MLSMSCRPSPTSSFAFGAVMLNVDTAIVGRVLAAGTASTLSTSTPTAQPLVSRTNPTKNHSRDEDIINLLLFESIESLN